MIYCIFFVLPDTLKGMEMDLQNQIDTSEEEPRE
jgi:hypothetical protein